MHKREFPKGTKIMKTKFSNSPIKEVSESIISLRYPKEKFLKL